VRKDALAIHSSGKPDLPEILRRVRAIDQEFLARVERLPFVQIRIRYEDIEPIRKRRMQQLLEVAARLLQTPWRGIRPAVRACYGKAEFETVVREHLRLYAAEVHALSRSSRLAVLLAPLGERLRRTMDEQANALAREVSGILHG
jgi:hypothetical protein